jgi:glycosyltransferase involved in cell wall biosynthesis
VEPDNYVMKDDFLVGETPRLGWIGSPSTEGYLRLIEAPLLELHRRTGAVLLVISAGERSLGPLDQMVKRVPWSIQTQARLASLMDIGLMPLEDSLWTRGKCGYKLLQYGAAGVPAVASPFGANADIAASLGYRTACSSTDWIEALSELIGASASDRATEGARARSAVIRAYSYEAWLPTWISAVFGEQVRYPATRKEPQPPVRLTVHTGAGNSSAL